MRLEQLAAHHAEAFLNMIEDYKKSDSASYASLYKRKEWSVKSFAAFVKETEKQRPDWRPGPGKFSVTRYVLLNENVIVGNGVMRFPLDEKLENEGGNLLFDVPPSLRRQGFGALTLNRMLFEAVRAGLARVLVSCPVSHVGARKCIELNRGELETTVDNVARYWIRLR